MKYDPREHGARCNECPLGPAGCLRKDEWRPVSPEIHHDASVAAVLEAPKSFDVAYGRPLVGPDGEEWALALGAIGLSRVHIDLFHTISCEPPGKWQKMEADLRRQRKHLEKGFRKYDDMNATEAKREAAKLLPHPVDCCAPHRQRYLANYDYILPLGVKAAQAVLHTSRTLGDLEGDMIERPARALFWDAFDWTGHPDNWTVKVVPALDPGFVKHAPKQRPKFHATLGKALRWFNNALTWREPIMTRQPSPAQLRAWLAQPAPMWVYDYETDGVNVMDIGVDCVAIATPDVDADGRMTMPWETPAILARTVGIHLNMPLNAEAPEGQRVGWYTVEEIEEIKDILKEFFLDQTKLKVGMNAGYFDRQVSMHWLGLTPTPCKDTLFDARFMYPDLPKGLKHRGRLHTDVHKWETSESGEGTVTRRRQVADRLTYCMYDTVVNARIELPMRVGADNNGAARPLPDWAKPIDWPSHRPWDLRHLDHARQDMCVGMHQNGVYVDRAKVAHLTTKFEKVAEVIYADLQELAQRVGLRKLDEASASNHSEEVEFKPGSYDQIRDLLYNKWDLGCPYGMDTKDFYTDTGLPGTGDAVLRAHMAGMPPESDRYRFMERLRQYRRVRNKVLGTQLYKMVPFSEGGVLHPDGRVRSTWNSHVTAPGRLSSSGPNMQNQSSRKDIGGVRTIYCAAPGNMLVGCDLDQAHLRIAANYWQIERLLECFLALKDPHCWLAHDIFGKDFERAEGWRNGFSLAQEAKPNKKKKAGQMRELAKSYRYASIYAASAETKHGMVRSTEMTGFKEVDGAERLVTSLPYLDFELTQIQFFDKVWHDAEPDWKRAWAQMEDLFRKQGFMEDPLFGRRSGTLSGGKLNEVVNFPILACEAAAMSIAEQRVLRSFPFQKWGPGTGLVAQVHDSMIVEVPEHLGEWAKAEMTRCMTIEVPGWDVPFTCEADLGRTWAEV